MVSLTTKLTVFVVSFMIAIAIHLALGWTIFSLCLIFAVGLYQQVQGSQNVMTEQQAQTSAITEEIQQARQAYKNLLFEIDELMAECRNSILAINSTQNDAVETLTSSFTNLKHLTEFQSREIVSLIQSGKTNRAKPGWKNLRVIRRRRWINLSKPPFICRHLR